MCIRMMCCSLALKCCLLFATAQHTHAHTCWVLCCLGPQCGGVQTHIKAIMRLHYILQRTIHVVHTNKLLWDINYNFSLRKMDKTLIKFAVFFLLFFHKRKPQHHRRSLLSSSLSSFFFRFFSCRFFFLSQSIRSFRWCCGVCSATANMQFGSSFNQLE